MLTDLLNSTWEKIHKEQKNKYGLAEVYDELVSSGYFDYKQTANTLIKIFGKNENLKILELCIGTGNLAILLSKDYKIYGVDHCPDMLLKLNNRIQEQNISITVQQNDIANFHFAEKFDFIYSHSADPMIFWAKGNNKLELAINSREQLKAILKNAKLHLNSNGSLLINIEHEHIDFPSRYDVNIVAYKYNNLGVTRKIYEVKDKITEAIYLHTSQKEKRCEIEEAIEIFYKEGFSNFEVDNSGSFCIFQINTHFSL